jgi:hypothetical protein
LELRTRLGIAKQDVTYEEPAEVLQFRSQEKLRN